MFILKKLLTPLSSPFFVALLLLAVGVGLLWLAPKRARAAKVVTTVAFALLLLFGYGPVSELFLGALEASSRPLLHPERLQSDIRWVVVLGAGHSSDELQPPNNQLNSAALARVVEGVRQVQALPNAKLILSGGAVWQAVSQGEMLARTAELLGVPRARMLVESESRDTIDEARLLRDVIKTDAFILVTSASHMPRSLRLFEKQGMKGFPAPADVKVFKGQPWDPNSLFPSAGSLHEADVAFHEFAGMLFAKLRGQM